MHEKPRSSNFPHARHRRPSPQNPRSPHTGNAQGQRQQNMDELVEILHAGNQFLFKRGGIATSQSKLFIHAPILNRFGDVHGLDILAAGEIGDGARHFEYTMVGARREIQARNGLTQQCLALCVGRAE